MNLMVNVVIPTCNQYAHLIPRCVAGIRRHWADNSCDVEIYVLHYSETDRTGWPLDIVHVDMGTQPPRKIWTDGIARVVDDLPDVFVLMLDDYEIVKPVNHLEVAAACALVQDGDFCKIELTTHPLRQPPNCPFMPGWMMRGQAARYRNSLQASVWDRRYFARFLRPGWTPWDFEIEGMKLAYNDGTAILTPDHDILCYKNLAQGERI